MCVGSKGREACSSAGLSKMTIRVSGELNVERRDARREPYDSTPALDTRVHMWQISQTGID